MTEQQFIELMFDEYQYGGCFHTQRFPIQQSTSGNHHVINATFHAMLNTQQNSEEMQVIRDLARNYIERCRDMATDTFNRAPDKYDHQAHDDYVAIAVSSYLLGLPYAKEIVDKHAPFFYVDNTEESTQFEFKNIFGRFGWTNYTFYRAAGLKPSFLLRLAFAIYIYVGSRNMDRTDTSGRILRWLQLSIADRNDWMLRWAIRRWENNIREVYPTARMGAVMAIYHGSLHPFALYMSGTTLIPRFTKE